MEAMDSTIKPLKEFAEAALDLKKSDADLQKVMAACAAGSCLLLRCREESRLAALKAESMKEETSQQRALLDHNSLQLHNLVYEQQYYDKEIAACRTFQSAVPDEQLGCISMEEFLQRSEPCVAALNTHERELARLNYELQQRKQLKAHLQTLQQKKQQALAGLNAETAKMDNMRSQMEAVSMSSKALMEACLPNTSAVTIKSNKEAAELLPLPLYIIYSQAAAGSSIMGLPIKAEIDGSTAAAARFAAEPTVVPESAAAAAAAAAAAQPAKRRRKSEAQHEDNTYKLHPLSVSLDIYPPNNSSSSSSSAQPLMQLTFQYYTQLKLVGVSAASPEDEEILTDLFLGDLGDGQLLENVAACSSGPYQFGAPGLPRPFRWAQDLAGVDVVASLPSSYTAADKPAVLNSLSAYRSQMRLEAFIDRLAAAKQGRLAMKSILAALANKEQPPSSWDNKVLTSLKNVIIEKWSHVSDSGMRVSKQVQQLMATGRQADAGTTGAAKQPVQIWRPSQQQQQQQGSVAEEGEVAGAGGDGPEETSRMLTHGDTAEEDLLQGLLDDAGGAATAAAERASVIAADAAAPRAAEAAAAAAAAAGGELLLLEDDAALMLEDYEGYEKGYDADDGSYHEPSNAGEASSESEDGGEDDAATAGAAAASGGSSRQQALLARHSLYKLVLHAPNVEASFHVKVFWSYPVCPPLFTVRQLLDVTRSKPAPMTAVNEVLRLEQQANSLAVQAAAASDPCEVLAVQVLQLRQCLDTLSSQMKNESSSKDLIDRLRAKQQLRGRDRQARFNVV